MPTMKEIAEALEKAATIIECRSTTKDGNDFVALLESLASQVEQKRCETCEWFDDTQPAWCFYPGEEFDSDCAAIDWCGPNFCCIHHKFKGLRMTKSLICHSCKCECSLVKFTNEDFTSPGHISDYYRSDCCHDYVEDYHGRIYWPCELSHEYIKQQSWEVSEDDLLQR